ncbi:MAG: hypothetical protein ONB27_10190 [candidate division KSB1 bacterium]|nr:hypothetical protein [candidate division KSB1 bacterium]
MLNRSALTLFLLMCWIPLGCTKNPFDSDRLANSKNVISGEIKLADGVQPDSIYVWLEGLDVGGWTDRTGRFEIRLPSASSRPEASLTGVFKLYFYLANYGLDSAEVVLRQGRVEFGHGDITSEGQLRERAYLKRILNVRTTIIPQLFPEFSADTAATIEGQTLRIELAVQAVTTPVTVEYPNCSRGPVAILFIQPSDAGASSLKILDIDGTASHAEPIAETIYSTQKLFITYCYLRVGQLASGNYKIIPYFYIRQRGLPAALLQSLGANVLQPEPDFLKIPMKRDGGDFRVR